MHTKYLRDFTSAVYIVGAEVDHIVPWRSSYKSARLYGKDARYVLSNGGHIADIVNPPSRKSRCKALGAPDAAEIEALPDSAEGWAEKATHTDRRWWENWAQWGSARGGDAGPAAHGQCDAPAAGGSTRHVRPQLSARPGGPPGRTPHGQESAMTDPAPREAPEGGDAPGKGARARARLSSLAGSARASAGPAIKGVGKYVGDARARRRAARGAAGQGAGDIAQPGAPDRSSPAAEAADTARRPDAPSSQAQSPQTPAAQEQPHRTAAAALDTGKRLGVTALGAGWKAGTAAVGVGRKAGSAALGAGKKAGLAGVDAYEKSVETAMETQKKMFGSTGISAVDDAVASHTTRIGETTAGAAKAARGVLGGDAASAQEDRGAADEDTPGDEDGPGTRDGTRGAVTPDRR
ncbi:hypothetical protein [Tomitella cavernea]|uniref:Uncharacterized protein n=2 Tax=Tomitella cavernea TaxID=1387982 RepID=A0ABP9C6Y0_9ACTN